MNFESWLSKNMLLNMYFAIAYKIIIFFYFFCYNYLWELKKSSNFVGAMGMMCPVHNRIVV